MGTEERACLGESAGGGSQTFCSKRNRSPLKGFWHHTYRLSKPAARTNLTRSLRREAIGELGRGREHHANASPIAY